jgi:hypothetical protein
MIIGISGKAGCLSGDTKINFNRTELGRVFTIENAYKSWNGIYRPGSRGGWNRLMPTFVRSFNGVSIRLNEVEDIVYSGKKNLFLLELENGLKLKATINHEIMTDCGWVELGKLRNFMNVMCDTLRTSKSFKKNIKRRDKTVRSLSFYPYGYKDGPEGRRRVEEYRLIYDANINGITLKEIVRILRKDKKASDCLVLSSPELHIHHKDFDHTNNDPSNLECLTKDAHLKIHSLTAYNHFNQGVPTYSKPISITPIGLQDTFDICCKAPHHNFVANGIVVHNSGKSTVANILVQDYGFREISFAEPLKDICSKAFQIDLNHFYDSKMKQLPFAIPIYFDSRFLFRLLDQIDSYGMGSTPYIRASIDRVIKGKLLTSIRDMLQFVGTDIIRNCIDHDAHVKMTMNTIEKSLNNCIVLSDVRFRNEFEMVKKMGGTMIEIKGDKITNDEQDSHISENDLKDYHFDCEIINDKSKGIDNLKLSMANIISNLKI